MKFVLKPSLEHMALVKFVISLWNQNDVRALIEKHNFCELYSNERWMVIEGRVKENVLKLLVPQLLGGQVLGCIKPIGLQVKSWMEFHIVRYNLLLNLPTEFCWTSQGTVDRKRTAEVLVRDENMDMSTRYILACIYCLERDIIHLWKLMPKNLKESVSCKFPIITVWSRDMEERELGIGYALINFKDQFLKSVYSNNRVAAEYFLRKVIPREREESLLEAAKHVLIDTEVLYFLISKMNEKQQMAFFRNNPLRVLTCFLQWPLQSFFIETANCMWEFLSKVNYNYLLIEIVHKAEKCYKDWNYQELFREFWQKSPTALKSSVINKLDKSSLLPSLFRIKDKQNIRLILQETTLTTKEKFIYSYEMNTFCENFIQNNEWDFLEFFIRECLPSKNAMLKYKKEFERRMYFKDCSPLIKSQWNRLFSFCDDSICKYDKRGVGEDESS